MKTFFTSLLLFSALLCGCTSPKNPPSTAQQVNLKEYMGTWYEIASFPNRFQKGCRCTSAEYKLLNNKVSVLNRCIKGDNQYFSEAKGVAWLANKNDPSKLKVRFFWPFKGDYWILYVAPDYQYALVGSPKRNYLWILSRKKIMDEMTYQKLIKIAKQKGFDTSKLVKTTQNCNN